MRDYLVLDVLEKTAARLPHKQAFADPDSALTFEEFTAAARRVGSALTGCVTVRRPCQLSRTSRCIL